MAYRIEFFSGANSDEQGCPHGYDGSMSVATFSPSDLPALAASMDCVFGECLAVVTSPEGFRSAHPFTRRWDDEATATGRTDAEDYAAELEAIYGAGVDALEAFNEARNAKAGWVRRMPQAWCIAVAEALGVQWLDEEA